MYICMYVCVCCCVQVCMYKLIRNRPHYVRLMAGLTCKNQSVLIRHAVSLIRLFSSSMKRTKRYIDVPYFARFVRRNDIDWWFPFYIAWEEFIHANERCFIDILPPFPTASGSIRQFRFGSRECNIMERYCARERKLGMHGSPEYSRHVNTGTLLAEKGSDREKWYELSQARRGGGCYREQICRAQLAPEVPRTFYSDGGQCTRFAAATENIVNVFPGRWK